MVSHCQESIEFGHALDSWFRLVASCFWYRKKTWNCAKTFFGVLSILPPPKKIHFLLRTRDFSRKGVCGFSNRGLQENVFNRANLFGGAIFMFSPFNPLNPVSSWLCNIDSTTILNGKTIQCNKNWFYMGMKNWFYIRRINPTDRTILAVTDLPC